MRSEGLACHWRSNHAAQLHYSETPETTICTSSKMVGEAFWPICKLSQKDGLTCDGDRLRVLIPLLSINCQSMFDADRLQVDTEPKLRFGGNIVAGSLRGQTKEL
ncbi:hypothetical protein Ct61P_06717 [Colletotrichum tofieldiae]|nr:hypothetical protein Ct61P_06717 [Colletotrichum tofieldiae]